MNTMTDTTTHTTGLSDLQREALGDVPSESAARMFGFLKEHDGRTMGALARRGLVRRVTVGVAPWRQSGWVLSSEGGC